MDPALASCAPKHITNRPYSANHAVEADIKTQADSGPDCGLQPGSDDDLTDRPSLGPDCGLQPDEAHFRKREFEDCHTPKTQRGWRRIVRNFTPS